MHTCLRSRATYYHSVRQSIREITSARFPKEGNPTLDPGSHGCSASSPSTAPLRFAALDFETADYGRDSACALSLVIVENDTIADVWTTLIRPPRRDFVFTYLHGIAWEHVKNQPPLVSCGEKSCRGFRASSLLLRTTPPSIAPSFTPVARPPPSRRWNLPLFAP